MSANADSSLAREQANNIADINKGVGDMNTKLQTLVEKVGAGGIPMVWK